MTYVLAGSFWTLLTMAFPSQEAHGTKLAHAEPTPPLTNQALCIWDPGIPYTDITKPASKARMKLLAMCAS